MRDDNRRNQYFLVSLASVITVLLVWYACIDVLELKSQIVFPGPVKIFRTFILKLHTRSPDGATLLSHLGASLKVTMLGYLLGAAAGIPLGIAMAWNRLVDRLAKPLFDLLRPIPGIAWIPLFILLFGIGTFSKALVIFLSSFVACTVNSFTGIRQTKDVHLWVGNVFGATRNQLLFRIAVPTAIPMVFTGLRVALGASWAALVAAELLASNVGLGYMIQQSRAISRTDIIIVGMLAIGMVGAILDKILHAVEARVAKGMNVR
ncbi:MAG: ABC transporter permease [Planctomycetota bacterium]|jgi:ABC-type nitrate/sulfonate/bicarbonate transport system permease component|nr:ABC transporter permease [Planctomycetota bacterium]